MPFSEISRPSQVTLVLQSTDFSSLTTIFTSSSFSRTIYTLLYNVSLSGAATSMTARYTSVPLQPPINSLIMRWNALGADLIPNYILVNLYVPIWVIIVVNDLLSTVSGTWWYAAFKSSCAKYLFPVSKVANKSPTAGKGNLSDCMQLLRTLKSPQIRKSPFFFFVMTIGLT